MPMKLPEERIKLEMTALSNDLASLFSAKYPRLHNAFDGLEETQLIELMIELCDVFDLYRDLTHEIARLYHEHRRSSGSLEERDWPEN